jgi:hypothetical protein
MPREPIVTQSGADQNEHLHRNQDARGLLDRVQRETLKYFVDFAHPISGMARERSDPPQGDNTLTNDAVTTGGTGFGIMAIIAGIERGWIERDQGVTLIHRIVLFLFFEAAHFRGVFPHWMDGSTGHAKRFSRMDDGGDLVETAFLVMGLLCAKQYFSGGSRQEREIGHYAKQIYKQIDWMFFTKDDEHGPLYWHWSPNHGWYKDHPIVGWNECLVAYVLATGAEKYSISPESYHKGWARRFVPRSERSCEMLRSDAGGPLFFAHYTFMGLDPRGLCDRYADYFSLNVAHVRANREYCLSDVGRGHGYHEGCWGLTASTSPEGYSAHHPRNDRGVIAPTAALASMPYAPYESIAVLEYIANRDELWGRYGPVDSFCADGTWVSDSALAIDQAPIVVMIENFRSGLLWKLFMSAPEVQLGLERLGFHSPWLKHIPIAWHRVE